MIGIPRSQVVLPGELSQLLPAASYLLLLPRLTFSPILVPLDPLCSPGLRPVSLVCAFVAAVWSLALLEVYNPRSQLPLRQPRD